MKKKLFAIVFAAIMLVSMTVIVGATEAVTGLSGTGASDDPYEIGTLAELKWFRDDVNEGNNYKGKYVKLTADIDISGEADWTPIGNGTNEFAGYFDGQDNTISGLTITSSPEYAGLFGYIGGSGMSNKNTPSVQNLILSEVDVKGGQHTGALSGQMFTTYVKNITVTGNVDGGKFTGGIVGHVYTVFEDCSFTGNVVSINQSGGIAGSGDCRAYNCTVVGDITAAYWAGGIVGNGQEGTSIVGCYVKGDVTANNNWYFGVGGLAGVAGHGYAGSEFSDNYFDGEVFLEDEKVDTPIVGFINASGDEVKTEVSGNSWNTENYPADLNVVIAEADMPSSSPTPEEHASSAKETVTRNNNIVGSISDLQYVESGAVAIVGDDVTADDLADELDGNEQFEVDIDEDTGVATVVRYAAKVGGKKCTTINEAIEAIENNEGDTLELYSGTYDAFEINVDNVTITGVSEDTTVIVNSTSDTAFIGVGGHGVTIEGIKFVVPENCGVVDLDSKGFTNRKWLASVVGFASSQYNYGGVEPNGWDVKNCDFVNEGDDIAYAIFNVDEYEVSGCTFNGFSTGVCSMGDGSSLETVSITNNTFTEVDYPLNVYWGVGGGAGELTITGNIFESPKDSDTIKLLVDDYATRQSENTEGSTVKELIVDNNTYNAPTETVIVDFSKDAVVEAGEGETVINSYTSLDTARAAVEEGEEFYLNYGSDEQTSAIINDGEVTYTDMNPEGGVAFVDGEFYQTIQEALQALTDNSTLTLLQNITITETWDCRDYGKTPDYGTITESNVTIDGNDKTITFACLIDDAGNYDAVFRVEGSGITFKDLTIEVTNSSDKRVRAISSDAGDLTVTNCTFIGSSSLTNSNAIIFGEGKGNDAETDISIIGCTFTNWKRGVSDNQNGNDVRTVSITESTFTNANIAVSASETVTFADNTVNDSNVSIATYTNAGLSATIEGCELDGGNVTLGGSKLVNNIDVVMKDNYINVPVTSYSKTGELLIINNVIGKDAEFNAAGNISAHGNENSSGYDIEIGASGAVKIDYKTTGIFLAILRLKMEAKLHTFTITAEATEGGSIFADGDTNVKKGDSITYTFTADEGYELIKLIIDGEEVESADSYTFDGVDEDHTIVAVFEKDEISE